MFYTYQQVTPEGKTVTCVLNEHMGHVPPDPANTDYAAYLEWVAAGNTPEPWQPDASAPSTE